MSAVTSKASGNTSTGPWTRKARRLTFLLTAKPGKAAALRFFEKAMKAMKANGIPEKVAMDQSGANKAAIDEINTSREMPIPVQQVRSTSTTLWSRATKRVIRPMLNFKSFRTARNILAGIELIPMIRKGQRILECCIKLSFVNQFNTLAG